MLPRHPQPVQSAALHAPPPRNGAPRPSRVPARAVTSHGWEKRISDALRKPRMDNAGTLHPTPPRPFPRPAPSPALSLPLPRTAPSRVNYRINNFLQSVLAAMYWISSMKLNFIARLCFEIGINGNVIDT